MKKFIEKYFSGSVTRPTLMSILGIVSLASFAIAIFLMQTPAERIPVYIAAGVALVALVFAYRGILTVGQIVTPFVSFVVVSFFVFDGGVRDPSVFGYSAVILIAAMLLGEGGGLFFGLLSTGFVLYVGLSEASGSLVPTPPPPDKSDTIILGILLFGATLILHVLIRRLTESVKAAKEKEEAQIAANRTLKVLQNDLEKRIEERTAQLRASNEIGKIASSILDPDVVASKAVNLITGAFDYYYAAIFLVSENGRWAELKDATGSAGEILKSRRHRLQVGRNSMVGMAISTQKAQIALDVGEAAVRFNNPLLPNTRSEIALPLIVGERTIGALNVQSTRESDFNLDDISALQGIANQVAIAIENARLFKEMDATLEELRQSNRQYVASAWADRLKGNVLEYSTRPALGFSGEDSQEVQVNLNLRDQNIGHIRLETTGEWTPEDQSWVEALATQVAVSLENARLLEESQQSALRERISASIVQKIWTSSSIDSILQTAIRELGRALEASEATIELKIDE